MPEPPFFLQPHEIRYLRAALGWSQIQMGEFLGREGATISRWERGTRTLDPLAASILSALWVRMFGPYEGPYPAPEQPELSVKDEALGRLSIILLTAGVGYLIAKALEDQEGEDDDDDGD
jgi:transcriptional regulator with XRE-family HTH domain